eukprot:TRINITY_DN6577_c0_g1_i5.p1 TRINITY_DN6577_c0_g1~~TRINITY_DN6577_c0_g1_i5.p1  ORF type:complete len:622 (+),score=118.94 TRINITY_DN6577_c0_g1_i5:38-1903(+)
MKVVGLVSGGKDSLASLGKCLKHGHEIVCVANLSPEEATDEELDSFCFQTVGHNHVDKIASAMGLPLVKGTIKRDTSKVQCMAYPARPSDQEDEVERLYDLLSEVKKRFPEVTAVSSGAILSNYQRLRVESVATRLGLVSLSYLWQRDQDDYVKELTDEGYEAAIIKIASMGMKKSHLGRHLSEFQSDFESLDYLHSAGEGGEYETLITDCPLFDKKFVIKNPSIEMISDDKFAPVGHITFQLESEDKSGDFTNRLKPVPLSSTLQKLNSSVNQFRSEAPLVDVTGIENYTNKKCWTSKDGIWCIYANMSGSCVDKLLSPIEGLKDYTAFVHVYGKSISNFAAVNKAYNPNFDANPPSRAFVENNGQSTDVTIDVLMYKQNDRKTLHVQSISEWAPACIGPYAQATTVGGTVLHAGMLGLDPASMILTGSTEGNRSESVYLQASRAIKSYHAVMPIVESSMELVGLGVAYVLDTSDFERVAAAWDAEYHSSSSSSVYPVCVAVTVSALPKFAAFELQLFSSILSATPPCLSSEEGIVMITLPSMAYALCPLTSIPEGLKKLSDAGFEPGHVKVFTSPGDYPSLSECLSSCGDISTSVLATQGCVVSPPLYYFLYNTYLNLR